MIAQACRHFEPREQLSHSWLVAYRTRMLYDVSLQLSRSPDSALDGWIIKGQYQCCFPHCGYGTLGECRTTPQNTCDVFMSYPGKDSRPVSGRLVITKFSSRSSGGENHDLEVIYSSPVKRRTPYNMHPACQTVRDPCDCNLRRRSDHAGSSRPADQASGHMNPQ